MLNRVGNVIGNVLLLNIFKKIECLSLGSFKIKLKDVMLGQSQLDLPFNYRKSFSLSPAGVASGVVHKSRMTVEDCFELGKIAYTEADYYHTELWMAQALTQLDEGEESIIEKVTVMDYLSYSIYQQGELERALELTKRMLKLGKMK